MKKVIINKNRKTRKLINNLDNSFNIVNENRENENELIKNLYFNIFFENNKN